LPGYSKSTIAHACLNQLLERLFKGCCKQRHDCQHTYPHCGCNDFEFMFAI
jgi:hypothetical protein